MKRYLIPILLVLTIWGCSKDSSDPDKLTIGLMPAVDTAPIFLAQKKGYFQQENLTVDIQLYTNAQDRQSALQTNQIDGAMTDLVAVAVNVAGGFNLKATTLTDGMFPILAQPGVMDKEKIKVGMMEISVSNFLIDNWLSSDYEVEKVYINAIPARLEGVLSGQTDAGLFPEPIASVGALQGLEKKIYQPVDGFSPDVMVFTPLALKEKNRAIQGFHKAYNRGVADIQADEGEARDILIDSIPNLKPALRDKITLPEYHMARLPHREYLNKIIEWTREIVPQELDVTPEQMVDRSFVE